MLDFNLGFPEVVVLVVLAIVIFGPDKLPELARKAGRVVRYLRGIANNAREQIQSEIPELAEINLAELNPKAIAGSLLAPVEEVKQVVQDAGRSLDDARAAAVSDPGSDTDAESGPQASSGDAESAPIRSAAEGEKTAPFDAEAT
jgi:sec-independent protein translocase protein TatB